MEWYEIVGALGGLGGVSAFLISLYHAKSNKETIDANNADKLVEAAHKLVAEVEVQDRTYCSRAMGVNVNVEDYRGATQEEKEAHDEMIEELSNEFNV